MAYMILGPDPVEQQVQEVLNLIVDGNPPSTIERAQVDVKEEPGRRDRDGSVQPGSPENDAAARYLARELACFANTAGGGAIVLGVADDGTVIGTELDPGWLRHRIWELTAQKLTVHVRGVGLGGTTLLVLTTHEAIEPIRYDGKIRWRVDDHCVEVDPTSWHAGKLQRSGVDWSAQPSGHRFGDVSPVAVALARRYLQDAAKSGDTGASELAGTSDEDLLRRLNVVDGDGRLTNAGSLLFVGTPSDGVDYIRREVSGGDSTSRVRGSGPLIEQVYEVDRSASAANRIVHVPDGFVHGQQRAIPERALREAIVNGVVHRDWLSPTPTLVEHVADTATVTSPGGFVGGIDATNIITHPAVPRYRSLAEAMAGLRLAEREGIGIDRMVRDMLAVGHPMPEITSLSGPYVRVGLFGGDPDRETLEFLAASDLQTPHADVDALLIINQAAQVGWIDTTSVAPVLQRPPVEAEAAIRRLEGFQISGEPVIVGVDGVPDGEPQAFRLSDAARHKLSGRTARLSASRGCREVALAWARHRGRVSTTELRDLCGISQHIANTTLKELEQKGLLGPGREARRGRGFFYVPVVH